MKKLHLFGLAVLVSLHMGLTGHAFAQKAWIELSGQDPAQPRVEVLHSNSAETVIKFEIPGFWVEEIDRDGQVFHQLSFPDYGTTQDLGLAALPLISELVAIPGRAEVSVEVIDRTETVLPGYRVLPFQKLLRRGEEPGVFAIDRKFYREETLYPEAAVLGKPAIWRDLRVINLRVAPVRYSPARGELAASKSVTVRLTYGGFSNVNVLDNDANWSVTSEYDAMYRSSVLNYQSQDLAAKDFELPDRPLYEMLIITRTDFVDDLQPLIEWKERRGIRTKLYTTDDVGPNTCENIRSFIQGEYEANHMLYVLLVGGPYWLPPYPDYEMVNLSDFYYTLLAGDDNLPDVGIGRIPAELIASVQNMVDKIITYERNPPAGDWLNTVGLIAHQECTGIKESIRTASYAAFQPDFITVYGEYGATNQDIVDLINGGVRVVNYIGHGDEECWTYWNTAEEDFCYRHLSPLDNGAMTPVVVSAACLTGNLEAINCLGVSWISTDSYAVGFLGASDMSIVFPTNALDIEIYKALYDDGVPAMSDAINQGFVKLVNEFYKDGGIITAQMYLWLGDPSLRVRYCAPSVFPVQLALPEDESTLTVPGVQNLAWEPDENADYYQVQVATDAEFTDIIAQEDYADNQVNIQTGHASWETPELGAGLYSWRVRAGDRCGYGAWSEVWSFDVTQEVTAGPELIYPTDRARFDYEPNLVIPFEWQMQADSYDYLFQLDDNEAFSSPYEDPFCPCHELNETCTLYVPPLEVGTYYWRVKSQDYGFWSDVWSFEIKKEKPTPGGGRPHAKVYPNPLNPSTTISFDLPRQEHVLLQIYDIQGKRVTTLVDETRGQGTHQAVWNGTDSRGMAVASGQYFYRFQAGETVINQKLLLLK